MAQEKPLSTGEVARLLHVTPVAVLGWTRAGKLPAYRVPDGRHRVDCAEFRKFLAENQFPVTLDTPTPQRVLVTGYPYNDETMAALDYGPPMLRKPIKLTDINAVFEIVFKEPKTP